MKENQVNLGCGTRVMEGWTNVDMVPLPGVDVVHDLDVFPWPFEDGQAVIVVAFDIFEHVDHPLEFVNECWRVLQDGGLLVIHTSHWQTENSYTDPTHKRFCTERTFDYWCVGNDYFDRYGPAYNRGCTFNKVSVERDGQELAVQLVKLPKAEPATDLLCMADFTDLDWAFTCPESVTDDTLRSGYEVLVARCQAEGAHLLTMNTPYQLVIERTITGYIRAKQAERYKYGQSGGYEHAGQEKDFNTYVMKMLHELNDMMRKDHPTADRDFTLQQVREVILDVVRGMPDSGVRDDLARRFAVAFEQNGF